MSAIYTLGIDVGSTASKCIMLKDGQEIVAKSLIDVGAGTSGPQRAIDAVLENAGMKKEDMAFTLATGYGRNSLMNFADKQMSELSCHARGAYFLFPDVHTVIDIGGQDAKAIQLDAKGNIQKFVMNDKCAAGTGRFLDVMSRVLEVPLDQMGKVHFQAKEWAQVSSTCTVFAESEVISQLSKGLPRESIVAGVHQSVASKACSLAYRIGVKNDVVMCGGVAQNAGVVDAIEKELKQSIIVAPHPQITGALGAALMAYEELMKANK